MLETLLSAVVELLNDTQLTLRFMQLMSDENQDEDYNSALDDLITDVINATNQKRDINLTSN